MTPRNEIIGALGTANGKAWIHVIRHGESSHTPNAYYMISGGGSIDSLDKYPWPDESTTKGWKAVGAGQFIPHTWYGLQRQYPDDCKDFSPYAQDFGILALTAGRGALQDVLNGDIVTAIRKCREEWTSLPGAAENKKYTMEMALHVFKEWGGGTLREQPAAPVEDKSTTYQPTGGNMGTALMLLPLLAQWVPQIMSLIKPDSKSTAKDAQVAQTVLNVAAEAAGVIQKGEQATAANVGATVDMLQKDPELAKKVQEAVVTHPEIMGVLQIGEGGIQGARDFGKAIQVAEKPFWFNPTFWITVGLFPMMYMIAYSVLFTVAPDSSATVDDVVKLAWYQKIGFDPNTRTGLVNLIVGFVFGGVVGVWFGTSYGSQRKTELAASATEQAVGK